MIACCTCVPSLPPQHAFGLACPLRVDVPACGLFQLVCQCLQPDAGRLLACWGGVPDTLSYHMVMLRVRGANQRVLISQAKGTSGSGRQNHHREAAHVTGRDHTHTKPL